MKSLLITLLLISFPASCAVPASPGTVLTFYITDSNLNTSHRGIDVVQTAGLVEFTINGVPIDVPSTMTETAVDSGVFFIQLTIHATINGKPLQDGDVVVLTYHQRADYSGNPRTITQSVVLSKTSAPQLSLSTPSVRIGQDFLLKIYGPNWNLDSRKPDIIPLNLVEFHDGGFKTTLANPAFQVSTFGLRETGPDTNLFYANLKIPRQIDGHTLEMGSVVEFSFTDPLSQDAQETKIQLKIGYSPASNVKHPIKQPANISVQASSSSGAVVQYQTDPNGEIAGVRDPLCFPSSNSLFPIGRTTVSCSGKDSSGNSVVRTFTVEVLPSRVTIPSSVRSSASSWYNDEIDRSDFAKSLESLITKKIIVLPKPLVTGAEKIPPWFKNNTCWWVTGKISDDDFVSGIQYLISNGKTKG